MYDHSLSQPRRHARIAVSLPDTNSVRVAPHHSLGYSHSHCASTKLHSVTLSPNHTSCPALQRRIDRVATLTVTRLVQIRRPIANSRQATRLRHNSSLTAHL